ncbi:MAG TPA: hypothetical protein PLP17_08490, partial [Oligoflexia bacterium]|nr:hypothetical protein [Oligoflexia bacterium]
MFTLRLNEKSEALRRDFQNWLKSNPPPEITGRLELDAILDRIVADTARVMRCEFCSLRLYDPKTNELRIKAVYNLPADYV